MPTPSDILPSGSQASLSSSMEPNHWSSLPSIFWKHIFTCPFSGRYLSFFYGSLHLLYCVLHFGLTTFPRLFTKMLIVVKATFPKELSSLSLPGWHTYKGSVQGVGTHQLHSPLPPTHGLCSETTKKVSWSPPSLWNSWGFIDTLQFQAYLSLHR